MILVVSGILGHLNSESGWKVVSFPSKAASTVNNTVEGMATWLFR